MRKQVWMWASLTLVVAGCGGGDSGTTTDDTFPYKPGETTVIGQSDSPTEFTAPAGAGCLKDESGACVDLTKQCGDDAKVDVVVDKQGVVVSVICYPVSERPVSTADEKPPSGRTFGNNEVVVLDDVNDGDDLSGDVDIDSNNVTIWGESPATSVIGGNLTVSKNDGIVRGVRIRGNVTLSGNNAALLLCVVEGNVTLSGNNNVLASCDVYGTITVTGKNGAVVSNRVAGGITTGDKTACHDNISLTDKDGDKTFDAGEAGDPITCGAKDK